jgi:hypothetical protein
MAEKKKLVALKTLIHRDHIIRKGEEVMGDNVRVPAGKREPRFTVAHLEELEANGSVGVETAAPADPTTKAEAPAGPKFGTPAADTRKLPNA